MRLDLCNRLVTADCPSFQDAVDLARFLVQTTIGFVKFSVSRAKTVGGPIEIAAITKHEGFKWIERRHCYPSGLNGPEEPNASLVP
jgi:hypothetical protein